MESATVFLQLKMFGWGVLGSVGIEVVGMLQYFQAQNSLPERYKSWVFWILRASLAVMGGGLAVAYDIDKALLAINIGAATPLILQQFVQNVPVPQGAPAATTQAPARQLPGSEGP